MFFQHQFQSLWINCIVLFPICHPIIISILPTVSRLQWVCMSIHPAAHPILKPISQPSGIPSLSESEFNGSDAPRSNGFELPSKNCSLRIGCLDCHLRQHYQTNLWINQMVNYQNQLVIHR